MRRKISLFTTLIFFILLFTGGSEWSHNLYAQNQASGINHGTYRIVVLPFKKLNKGGNQELQTLVHGISETLAGALSTVQNFIVIDANRVKKYLLNNISFNQRLGMNADDNLDKLQKLTKSKLKGDYLIYGTFNKIGGQIQMIAKFMHVDSGRVLRAASIYGKYPDKIFELQEQLAAKLINAINGNMNARQARSIQSYTQSTGNFSAYQYYIKGRLEQLKYGSQFYPKAVQNYERAVAIDPKYGLAWAGLAESNSLWAYQIKYAKGDYQSKLRNAIKQGEKAVSLNPDLYQTYRGLAIAYIMNSNFSKAKDIIRKATALNDNDAEILWAKAQSVNYGYTAMGTPGKESYELIQKVFRINPDLIIARWSYAHSLYTLNKYEQSIEEFEKILHLNPEHSPSLYTIGLMRYNQKKYSEGLPYFRKAVRVAGHIPQNHYMLGLTLYQQGLYSTAIPSFENSYKLDRKDYKSVYMIGICHYNLKDYRRASKYLRQALQIKPDYQKAKTWLKYSEEKLGKSSGQKGNHSNGGWGN